MGDLQNLSAEICRITNCPYLPDLKRLHDIIRDVDHRLLHQWAQLNGNRIEALAAAIVAGLELWPYPIDILSTFSAIPSFRDAVLKKSPPLLDTLLAQASETDSGFEKYSASCIALLSHPLEIALPSSYAKFLRKSVERAASSLSAENLRCLYSLLEVLGHIHLDALPPSLMVRFQEALIIALKGLDVEARSEDMLRFAVLAKIASRDNAQPHFQMRESSRLPQSDSIEEEAQTTTPAQQFFGAKRAYKILDLVVLKVIRVCSKSSRLDLSEAVESLELSRMVVDAVDASERYSWVTKSFRKVEKLCEKILRQDIDCQLQCAALNFVASMFPSGTLPKDLMPLFESFLRSPAPASLTSSASRMCLLQMSQASLERLVAVLLDLASENARQNARFPTEKQQAVKLLNMMIASLPANPAMCNAVIPSPPSDAFLDQLNCFAAQCRDQAKSTPVQPDTGTGLLTGGSTQTEIYVKLRILILSSAVLLSSNKNTACEPMLLTLLEQSTETQRSFVPHYSPCLPPKFADIVQVSLFQAGSTPEVKAPSHDWRTHIVEELSRDTILRYQSITRIIGEICRDLELRCNEAERPLREEQAKCSLAQRESEALQIKMAELQDQARDRESQFRDMERDRDQLQEQLLLKDRFSQNQASELIKLQQDISRAKLEAGHALEAASESARQQDLTYLATLTGKSEMYEEQSIRLAACENHVEKLEHEIVEMRQQKTQAAQTINSTKLMIDNLKKALTAAEDTTSSKQAEIDGMKAEQSDLITTRENMVAQAAETSQRNDALVANLRTELEAARADFFTFQQHHNAFASLKTSQISHLEDLGRTEIEGLQARLACAEDVSKQRDSTVSELQRKNKKLRGELVLYATKSAEDQDVRRRVLDIVGAKNDNPSQVRREWLSKICRKYSLGMSPESTDFETNSIGDGPLADAETPAPKRTKRHQRRESTMDPDNARPIVTNARSQKRIIGHYPRIPLGSGMSTQNRAFSNNYPPVLQSVDPMQGNKVAQDIVEDGPSSDELDFRGDDSFAGIDRQHLSNVGRDICNTTLDGTTTEF